MGMNKKGRPILFSPRMADLVHRGLKTQTRRVVNPQPDESWAKLPIEVDYDGYWVSAGCRSDLRCPYGNRGDRLWVKESIRYPEVFGQVRRDLVQYKGSHALPDECKWIPSIFMPRAACRTVLEVVGVKVERVQECSYASCLAETGLSYGVADMTCWKELWESINGAESWEANPWVWVIEFRKVKHEV